MMTVDQAKAELTQLLLPKYGAYEARIITEMALQSLGSSINEDAYNNVYQQLSSNRPIQYVTGQVAFSNIEIGVEQGVLIPRPETDELVHWVLQEQLGEKLKVLDIGTGSGCIALALAKNLKESEIWGTDISDDALAIAEKNSKKLGLNVHFLKHDILAERGIPASPLFDVIVCNPPYILPTEHLEPHVVDHEPHAALFVTDGDPLQFYRAIRRFALSRLDTAGVLYLEVHADHGMEILRLYEDSGWRCELRHDMQGHPRMLRCTLP